ncbi:MAG: ribonuclease D [Acidobacteriota bacterium]
MEQTYNDFQLKLLTDNEGLASFQSAFTHQPLVALDIETSHWWDKTAEKLSLIQLALPRQENIEVWVIDCFATLELRPVQELLMNNNVRKVIHNASFDVTKLRRLANILVENVHDTMLAARRAGERSCSLAALAARHLGIQLDKRWQRSDWSRRPLDPAQLEYAAQDAVTTLLLYQKQIQMGLNGEYTRRGRHTYHEEQPQLTIFEQPIRLQCVTAPANEAAAAVLIQIVAQFPGRYTPQALANCLGRERGGLAGWIVDQALSKETIIEYQEALTLVVELITAGRLIDRGRRLSVGTNVISHI